MHSNKNEIDDVPLKVIVKSNLAVAMVLKPSREQTQDNSRDIQTVNR